MKKIAGNLLKNLEISWNFVSPKKWEPCSLVVAFGPKLWEVGGGLKKECSFSGADNVRCGGTQTLLDGRKLF